MKPGLRSLIFTSAAIVFSCVAWANDCEIRLESQFAFLIERAFEQNLISIDRVRELAEAERPFNPMETLTPLAQTSAFRRVLQAHLDMAPETWSAQRARLRKFAETRGALVEQSLHAKWETGALSVFSPIDRIPVEGTVYRWLQTADDRVLYLVLSGEEKRISIYEYGKSEPVWVEKTDLTGIYSKDGRGANQFEVFLYQNEEQHTRLQIYRLRKRGFFESMRSPLSEGYTLREIDFSSGTDFTREITLPGGKIHVQQPGSKENLDTHIHVPMGSKSIWSFNLPEKEYVLESKVEGRRVVKAFITPDNRFLIAASTFITPNAGRRLEIWEPKISAAPTYSVDCLSASAPQLTWLVRKGKTYLIVDAASGGTQIFDPFDGTGKPMADFDGRKYKSEYFTVMVDAHGQIDFYGLRDDSVVHSAFFAIPKTPPRAP